MSRSRRQPRRLDLGTASARRPCARGGQGPLDPRVATLPGIEIRQESAFAQQPAAGTVRNFLCTIKFQGDTDFATQRRFAAIPGSRLMHLHANKHELTWVHSTDRRGRT
jgi:hypothetical protein